MHVLLVHSGNAVKDSSEYTFVKEQGDALARIGIEVDYYAVRGRGICGYLRNIRPLRNMIKQIRPDVIHAHYGLCGMLVALSKGKTLMVVTFHNGEILTKIGNLLSSIAAFFADYNIFVSAHIYKGLLYKAKQYTILPCGVDLECFREMEKRQAMQKMNLSDQFLNILFGGAFDNERKNIILARKALNRIRQEVNLIEMKGWNREEVATLLCGCDMLLLTSKSEGSPQVVKEALACNCPVVSTNVGDVSDLLNGVDGCYVTSFDENDVAEKIKMVLQKGTRVEGRKKIELMRLGNNHIAERLKMIYEQLMNG